MVKYRYWALVAALIIFGFGLSLLIQELEHETLADAGAPAPPAPSDATTDTASEPLAVEMDTDGAVDLPPLPASRGYVIIDTPCLVERAYRVTPSNGASTCNPKFWPLARCEHGRWRFVDCSPRRHWDMSRYCEPNTLLIYLSPDTRYVRSEDHMCADDGMGTVPQSARP